MFTHVMVGTDDMTQSVKFYDAVLGCLGIENQSADKSRGIYREENVAFVITVPSDGKPASFANGGTISFRAQNSDEVDAAHAAGVANGGSDEGAPGPRAKAPNGAYGAYLRDPCGNKICVSAQPLT